MTEHQVRTSPIEVLPSLRLQQREGWQRGERRTVETLLASIGEVALPDDAILELILSEFDLREEFGEKPTPADYFHRFPQWQQRLERLFAVRSAMENTATGQAADEPTDSEMPRVEVSPTVPAMTAHGKLLVSTETVTLGSYRLLEKLGEGGMGAVYKARHEKLKKIVAVKVLPPHLTDDVAMAARFQREMEAVGALDHPNIVRAMDAGEVDGRHFLVMEYVDGDDLSKIVKTRGPLPVGEACSLVKQTAAALQHAHDHGLVHRDIKPSNLICTRENFVKVLDLGLARLQWEAQFATESDLTESGQALGTIDYMSPEQARNSKGVDGRADIYSLGCTLYFLLTGKPLYEGRSRVDKLFSHRDDPIPSLHDSRSDIPTELDRVFQRMVAKRTEGRYASMTEVLHALGGVRADGGSSTHSPVTVVTTDSPSTNASATALLGGNSENGNTASHVAQSGTPLPPSKPKQPPPWRVSLLVAAGALLAGLGLFGVITVMTPDGKLIIESEVDDVDVVVTQQGRVVKVIDQQTGSQVTLTSGEYSLALKDDRNDVQLSKNRITLKRGKAEIVKITRVKLALAVDAVRNSQSSKATIRPIPQSNLEDLDFRTQKITQALLDNIANSPQLRTLLLSETDFGDTDLEHLRSLKKLQILWLHNTLVTDKGLPSIVQLKTLENLLLSNSAPGLRRLKITDDGVVELLKLPDLIELELFNTDISDRGVKALSALRKLKSLHLGQTSVTDAGIATLADLSLENFLLNETAITDGGLNHLARIKTLKLINLVGTKVTQAGIDKLHQALPQCRIEWDKGVIEPVATSVPAEASDEHTNSLGMKFRTIPAGEFRMGAAESDKDARDVERPQHRVKITKSFLLGIHEVTQSQYYAIMKANPSQWTDEGEAAPQSARSQNTRQSVLVSPAYRNHPVDGVPWMDAIEFCERLSRKEQRRYRLPTEAEWEYACRAETMSRYPTGNASEEVFKIANVGGNPLNPKRPLPVGTLAPNAWGLYDMNGNVREWCSDWFGDYPATAATDPQGPTSGEVRVVRGGCYHYRAEDGRSSTRFGLEDGHARNRGFRVVLENENKPPELAPPPREVLPAPVKE